MRQAIIFLVLSILTPSFSSYGSVEGERCRDGGGTCKTSYRSYGGKDEYNVNCVATYSNEVCGDHPWVRKINVCINEIELRSYWVENKDGSMVAADGCGPNLKEAIVNCNTVCENAGSFGGLCTHTYIECFGQKTVKAGSCNCDLMRHESRPN